MGHTIDIWEACNLSMDLPKKKLRNTTGRNTTWGVFIVYAFFYVMVWRHGVTWHYCMTSWRPFDQIQSSSFHIIMLHLYFCWSVALSQGGKFLKIVSSVETDVRSIRWSALEAGGPSHFNITIITFTESQLMAIMTGREPESHWRIIFMKQSFIWSF